MKIKTIVISVAVLGIAAAGLTVLNNNSSKPAAQPARVGTPILAADLVGKTAEIEISGKNATEKVVLKKSGDTWVVDSWAGLPADVSRLTSLIGGLQDNKVAAFITAKAERASGLNLGNSVLTLKDSAGAVLASLEIGDTSKSNGSYIRLKDDPNVYASETSLFVDTSKDSYASKQVVTVEEKDVAGVTISPAGGGKTISVKRAKAEDKFGAEGLAADEEINDAEVKTLLSNVLAARFDTLLASTDEKVTGAKDLLHTVTVTTFAGASYTLKVGRKPAPPLVLAPPPEPGEKKDEPAKTPDKPKVSATITADSSGKIINTETTVKNPDGTVTTTTTIPGEPGSTTSTKPAEGETKEGTAATPPVPVPPAPVTPPAPPAPPAEPGPVVVFYELPGSEAAWTNAFKANTPTVPAYILDRITEAPAKLISKKPPAPAPAPAAPVAPVPPNPAPAAPTPPAPASVTTPPVAVPIAPPPPAAK